MRYVKDQNYKTYYRSSTIPKGTMAELGTIEKDASSHFGRHDKKKFHAQAILESAVKNISFKTVLDIGAGECIQADYFKSIGKEVKTCDLAGISGAHCNNQVEYDFQGRFIEIDFKEEKFDFVFSSHTLEHQRNVGLFIDKMLSLVSESGYICVVVPIRKPFVTGGHLTLWNPGILLYNLVAAGIDCSESYVHQLDYDICVIVKVKRFDLKKMQLTYDRGDINLLSDYFPFDVEEPFNGDIMYNNTLFQECK